MTEPYCENQILWRLVDSVRVLSSIDYNGEWTFGGHQVVLTWEHWFVEKVTPKGAWVLQGKPGDTIFGGRKWVSLTTRFISRTKEEAGLEAVRKRAYHVKMEKKRLELAERRLQAIRGGVDQLQESQAG